jgi:hypothetical protein
VLLAAPKVLRPYILDVLRPLAVRAPQEMTFILKKQLNENQSAHIRWLARRTYPHLPTEYQDRIYSLIFDKGEE